MSLLTCFLSLILYPHLEKSLDFVIGCYMLDASQDSQEQWSKHNSKFCLKTSQQIDLSQYHVEEVVTHLIF